MKEIRLALTAEGRAMSEALRDVSEQEFARLTNCPPWTLAELVVHTADSVRSGDFPRAPEAATPREAADYYRRPERSTTEYRQLNVERTQRHARILVGHTTAPEYFDSMVHSIVTWADEVELERVVEINRVGAMRLGDWLLTRVISLAAHGIDAAMTLGRSPWTTEPALRVTRPVLVALLGGEPPVSLDWDDQQFFEVGTGRRSLTEHERSELGSQAGRFPLLS
ncbi:maleylpyruvate isomerase N-terminal domain-containing protein [Actinopolymorpha alba]|uniref:maleylpyruvate isomerase N-terminal domain-containing protein n=1 Tax=Actinopolymorpha alba TaxID=533267 RepID=UPI00035E9359|nr:maleylpyruvate isomerase N-terminal domain-containing protein [Actinopolymorpha alba]